MGLITQLGCQSTNTKCQHSFLTRTWDQQLRPHYHLHCLIAAGALQERTTGKPDRWAAGGRQFLFSVRAISKMYRAKFLVGLKHLFEQESLDLTPSLTSLAARRQLLKRLWKKPWVVYSKAPFAGPAKLLEYLSRYTHRVAITNSRLLACANGKVTFSFRDRRDGDRRKQLTLPVNQFIGRFLTHVLPSRFMRIRHYGYLANHSKQKLLTRIRVIIGLQPQQAFTAQSAADWLKQALGIDSEICPNCGDQLIDEPLPNPLTPTKQRPKPRGNNHQPTRSTGMNVILEKQKVDQSLRHRSAPTDSTKRQNTKRRGFFMVRLRCLQQDRNLSSQNCSKQMYWTHQIESAKIRDGYNPQGD